MFFQHNKVLTSIDNQQKDDTNNQNLMLVFDTPSTICHRIPFLTNFEINSSLLEVIVKETLNLPKSEFLIQTAYEKNQV
jgi:hypothetical protein